MITYETFTMFIIPFLLFATAIFYLFFEKD